MKIDFQEVDATLFARLAGSFDDAERTGETVAIIFEALNKNPRRAVLDLSAIDAMDATGLTALETLCWKVAKNLGLEIRLANPSTAVKAISATEEITIPIYANLD